MSKAPAVDYALEIIEKANSLGIKASSHLSSISDEEANEIKNNFKDVEKTQKSVEKMEKYGADTSSAPYIRCYKSIQTSGNSTAVRTPAATAAWATATVPPPALPPPSV